MIAAALRRPLSRIPSTSAALPCSPEIHTCSSRWSNWISSSAEAAVICARRPWARSMRRSASWPMDAS